ncbi:MAG: dockerin type I repeat-containing protein, partial [Candidatus Neomarinimicrobiota bacterium]|nr:dockerin type I repeat-containing protein [Candidatus Neomarinimicrobiota bacterium]
NDTNSECSGSLCEEYLIWNFGNWEPYNEETQPYPETCEDLESYGVDCTGCFEEGLCDEFQQIASNDNLRTLEKRQPRERRTLDLDFNQNTENETQENLRTNMYTIERLDGETWVGVQSIIAYGQETYTVEATTLSDSTNTDLGLTEYRVIASMDDEVYISFETGIGYSVDNLPPAIPTNLFAVYSEDITQITWDESQDPNLQYYVIYRNNELYGYSDENNFIDEDPINPSMTFYQISAIDYSGNISLMSEPVIPSDFIIGDVTIDGQVNILDIIIIVDHIMGREELSFIQLQIADYEYNGIINVSDIVAIIYYILNQY